MHAETVSWSKHAIKRASDRVRARKALDAHQGRLSTQQLCVYLVKCLTSQVTMAVAINAVEVVSPDAALPKCTKDTGKRGFCVTIDLSKGWLQRVLCLVKNVLDLRSVAIVWAATPDRRVPDR